MRAEYVSRWTCRVRNRLRFNQEQKFAKRFNKKGTWLTKCRNTSENESNNEENSSDFEEERVEEEEENEASENGSEAEDTQESDNDTENDSQETESSSPETSTTFLSECPCIVNIAKTLMCTGHRS